MRELSKLTDLFVVTVRICEPALLMLTNNIKSLNTCNRIRPERLTYKQVPDKGWRSDQLLTGVVSFSDSSSGGGELIGGGGMRHR
jgi:hypothetical protein